MNRTSKLLTLAFLTLFVSGLATADVTIESFESSTPTPSLYGQFVNSLTINNTDNQDYTANITLEVTSQNCQWNSDYKPKVVSNVNGTFESGVEKQVTLPANTAKTFKWGVDTGNEDESQGEVTPCPGDYNFTTRADYDLDGNWEETIEQEITFFKLEVSYGEGNNVTVGERLPWQQDVTAGESVVTNVTLNWQLPTDLLRPGYMNLTFNGAGDNPIQPSWVEFCGFDKDTSYRENIGCISGDNKTKVDLFETTKGTINITIPENEPSGNYTGTVIFEEDPIPVPTTMSVTGTTEPSDNGDRPEEAGRPESPGKSKDKPDLPSMVPDFVENLVSNSKSSAVSLGLGF